MIQWNNLLARGLFSCLDVCYVFVAQEPAHVVIDVWPEVLSELSLNLALFPCWVTDLARPWWAFLPATDASSAFGFGLSIAKASTQLVREAASHAGHGDHHFRLQRGRGNVPEKKRAGVACRLPLHMSHFKTVLSVRAKVAMHSGALEAHGVALGLRRILRNPRHHSQRGCFFG